MAKQIEKDADDGIGVAGSSISYAFIGFDDSITGDAGANALDGGGGDDTLRGCGGNDTLIGGLGNDHLNGGAGIDVLKGASGNDVIIFDAADRRIEGGSGVDTLVLRGAGETLDLTAVIDSRYTGIEAINLTGTGPNALVLSKLDLLNLSDTSNQLRVEGDALDSVTMTTAAGWTDLGISAGYHSWTQGAAILKVDEAVIVNFGLT